MMARKEVDKKVQVNAMKICLIPPSPSGDFCVWLKALSNVFSAELT